MRGKERLMQLIEIKKNQLHTDKDKEKMQVIEGLIQDETCFLKLKADTSFGILEFLNTPKEEAITLYYDLLSPGFYLNH